MSGPHHARLPLITDNIWCCFSYNDVGLRGVGICVCVVVVLLVVAVVVVGGGRDGDPE